MSDPATPVEIDAAIERGQRKATALLTEQARLSTAMRGLFHEAGFSALVAAVKAELCNIARDYPQNTSGWIV